MSNSGMGSSSSGGNFPLDNLTYDLITLLYEKSKGLEAYDKYMRDAQSNQQISQLLQQLRQQDEQAIQQLQQHLSQQLSNQGGMNSQAVGGSSMGGSGSMGGGSGSMSGSNYSNTNS